MEISPLENGALNQFYDAWYNTPLNTACLLDTISV
jgi:hypothetical protein